MERRILAELFVEDNRAIEEDLGTIDYVQKKTLWLGDSGISVGQMRILDDDDPEDAKASDLADKIFNSEENKPMKIWALSYETTIGSSMDPIFHECLFDSYEKALKEFNKTVEDDKKWFLENTKNPKIRRRNDYFKIEDFTYTEYWYSIIKIIEKEVL